MKKTYRKKGQIEGSVSAMIMLIVGVGVSILVLIFVGALGGQTYNLVEDNIKAIGNNSVANESFTCFNYTGTPAATELVRNSIHTGTLVITNGSAAKVIGLGNFSVNYAYGNITLLNPAYNATTFNATYNWGDYEIGYSVKDGISASFEALEQTGDYLPIIVLAVVIALVLLLVLGMGMLNARNAGGTVL